MASSIEAVMVLLGLLGVLVGLIITIISLFAKSVRKRMSVIGISVITLSAGSFLYGYYETGVNMQNLPQGTYVAQSRSPSGVYTIKIYLDEGVGVTGDPSIRAEVVYHGTHDKQRNLYWAQYRFNQ